MSPQTPSPQTPSPQPPSRTREFPKTGSPNRGAELGGRVAVVTGAGSGIGRAVAIALAEAGARVVLCGRTQAKLEAVAQELPQDQSHVHVMHHEVPADCEKTVQAAISRWGRLDILVNNAGIYVAATVAETTNEAWQESLDGNLNGPFLLTRAALPHLRQAPAGTIVNVASTLGIRPIPGAAPYCVAKAGLILLSQATALEEASHGVRVNVVCPGVVDTPIHHQRVGDTPAAVQSFLTEMGGLHPLGRVGTPEEIAGTVLFLASDASAWTTGAILTVDGGISIQ